MELKGYTIDLSNKYEPNPWTGPTKTTVFNDQQKQQYSTTNKNNNIQWPTKTTVFNDQQN